MSGTEDYLDGLLNSISEKDLDTKKKTGSETMQTEEDIMNDMENDLLSKEAEDNFLEQFEKELQNEKSSPEEEKTDDFFNSLDQIVDGADHNNNDDDFLMDTLGDIPGIDDVTKTEGLSQAQTMEKEPDEQSEDTAEPAQASDVPEVILLVWMMQAAQDWMILETLAGLICLETVRQKKPKLLRMA